MKQILIIGSGLSGLTCALELASKGIRATLVSPYPSERAQSVMAAGGINAAIGKGDSPQLHARDTLSSGGDIAGKESVSNLCATAPELIRWLESLGVVFSREENGEMRLRALGGQSCNRTAYAGAATGKQIMSALIRVARKYECSDMICRMLGRQFHSALIQDGKCYGALLYNEQTRQLETVYADAVVIASGGQNALFGKTTGSTQCDGYVAAKLYEQGAKLKNLEFIQYHPTTLETPQKRMLISEAARGEGGRLYYVENGSRVYFMEDLYGQKGNLMPRDIVSKCIYSAPSQVYLDIAFLSKTHIRSRLQEVAELCEKYADLDVTKAFLSTPPFISLWAVFVWTATTRPTLTACMPWVNAHPVITEQIVWAETPCWLPSTAARLPQTPSTILPSPKPLPISAPTLQSRKRIWSSGLPQRAVSPRCISATSWQSL